MTITKYDKLFDAVLEDGIDSQKLKKIASLTKAIKSDSELNFLSKLELISVLSRAISAVIELQSYIHQQQSFQDGFSNLNNQLDEMVDEVNSIAQERDQAIGMAKAYEKAITEVLKKVPDVQKKARSATAQKGARARLVNDKNHQKLNDIESKYLSQYEAGNSLKQRGRLNEFYNNMAKEFDVDVASIKQRITKVRKDLGHSNRQKVSS